MRLKGPLFAFTTVLSLSDAFVPRLPPIRFTKIPNKIQASLAADEAGEPSTQEKWERWMRSGRRQGTSHDDIVIREKEEFGGIPRMERYTANDWIHNMITLPSSSVLKQITTPIMSCFLWGVLISLVHRHLLKTGWIKGLAWADHMIITKTPHSLLGSALGLLLVFRTNTAYSRFWEGRKIWEHIVNLSRDTSRMIRLYKREIGEEKVKRCLGLLAAFPYLLRQRVQPGWLIEKMERQGKKRFKEYEEEGEGWNVSWIDKRKTPWNLMPKGTLSPCAMSQNRPLWVCDRLGSEFVSIRDGPNFTNRERLTLVSLVDKLCHSIGECERIVQTPVPLNYARHTIRFLTLWCLTLPFAICGELGLATGPVMAVVAWTLFGIYEIGVQIEDPFQRTLSLSVICRQVRSDVFGDQWKNRQSAFDVLEEEKDGRGDKGDGSGGEGV
mmetsp:Transcript_2736/g.5627  ORF Transcript_2736/g.5627 Transcript_2736/m.5627 type:complete len:440 (+) Transcript_2736:171-1490(+)